MSDDTAPLGHKPTPEEIERIKASLTAQHGRAPDGAHQMSMENRAAINQALMRRRDTMQILTGIVEGGMTRVDLSGIHSRRIEIANLAVALVDEAEQALERKGNLKEADEPRKP